MATIRPARREDEAAVSDCVRASYAVYVARLGATPGPMLDDYAARIAQGVVYVLADGGAVQGLVVTWPAGDCQFVDNIAVHPRAQERGWGRQLLAFVERLARQGGRGAICLYTNEAMTENLALYRRWGFVETGRRVEHGFRRVYLRKALAPGAAAGASAAGSETG
jgi:ribosomal protein S18 acetylase RimI-like enzyme